jgi:hypothetical protein
MNDYILVKIPKRAFSKEEIKENPLIADDSYMQELLDSGNYGDELELIKHCLCELELYPKDHIKLTELFLLYLSVGLYPPGQVMTWLRDGFSHYHRAIQQNDLRPGTLERALGLIPDGPGKRHPATLAAIGEKRDEVAGHIFKLMKIDGYTKEVAIPMAANAYNVSESRAEKAYKSFQKIKDEVIELYRPDPDCIIKE